MDMNELVYWHWLLLGLTLLVLETLIPANLVFLWMGISALAVGGIAWVADSSWQLELVLFGVLSILSFFLHFRLRKKPDPSTEPTLNRRGHSYLGRTFTLGEPIINGIGKLRVDDSQWRIAGPDLPVGSTVKVVSVNGATLNVEPADQ